MGSIFGIFGDRDDDITEVNDEGKLRLRQEELDINKNKIESGEVILRKDVVEEKKEVDVPVTHEEVVIERRSLNNEACDTPIGDEETIRIPVSEERVEVGKHTVVTGEVSAHKREVEETRKVEETLKKEEARVDTEGNPNIVSKSTDDSFR